MKHNNNVIIPQELTSRQLKVSKHGMRWRPNAEGDLRASLSNRVKQYAIDNKLTLKAICLDLGIGSSAVSLWLNQELYTTLSGYAQLTLWLARKTNTPIVDEAYKELFVTIARGQAVNMAVLTGIGRAHWDVYLLPATEIPEEAKDILLYVAKLKGRPIPEELKERAEKVWARRPDSKNNCKTEDTVPTMTAMHAATATPTVDDELGLPWEDTPVQESVKETEEEPAQAPAPTPLPQQPVVHEIEYTDFNKLPSRDYVPGREHETSKTDPIDLTNDEAVETTNPSQYPGVPEWVTVDIKDIHSNQEVADIHLRYAGLQLDRIRACALERGLDVTQFIDMLVCRYCYSLPALED